MTVQAVGESKCVFLVPHRARRSSRCFCQERHLGGLWLVPSVAEPHQVASPAAGRRQQHLGGQTLRPGPLAPVPHPPRQPHMPPKQRLSLSVRQAAGAGLSAVHQGQAHPRLCKQSRRIAREGWDTTRGLSGQRGLRLFACASVHAGAHAQIIPVPAAAWPPPAPDAFPRAAAGSAAMPPTAASPSCNALPRSASNSVGLGRPSPSS